MAYNTSGTVGLTVIDTSTLIEHALRRCRILPSAQTPETVQVAKDSLYFLMLNVGNRGLNLWAVEPVFLGVNSGRSLYETPLGTLDVLNVVYSQPTIAAASFNVDTSTLDSAARVLRVGLKLRTAYVGKVKIEGSTDGVAFKELVVTTAGSYGTQAYNWVTVPVIEALKAIRVSSDSVIDVADIQSAIAVYDLPLTPWNRDAYMALNNKSQVGRPSTNYFFEKKLTPTLTIWPVPNNELDHLSLYIHRQSQDIGTLTQQIEIPQRWLDGIIWLLAARLCFELPGVDPTLIESIVSMADRQELEAEEAETDGLPIFLQPSIRCYSA